MQMLAVAFSIFLLALIGVFYPYNRGGLLSACVVLYALTAGIAGEASQPVFSGLHALQSKHRRLCVRWLRATETIREKEECPVRTDASH
jgi:hypothetical protein